ncbi:hypothetical protein GGR26_000048 [Lewinella marina]|uniref:hypothetical protein n=1 Tax=Neolewinella marina TaxID=438751 RepID=UPI00117BA2E7|nr:hypothetical protein [Neolewinella marina]NJB84303.1 hypothetical protein [Neolewinella marina]
MKAKIALCITIFILNCQGLLYGCDCSTSVFDLPAINEYNSSSNKILFKGILVGAKDTIINGDYLVAYKYDSITNYSMEHNGSLLIFTPASSASCGFEDQIGSKSIVSAYRDDDRYFTYREDCTKTVSEHSDPKKFQQWNKYLTSVSTGVDGYYEFKQPTKYYDGGTIDTSYKAPLLEYTIQDGTLNGSYSLYSRTGILIETGKYIEGKKYGTWVYREVQDNIDHVVEIVTTSKYHDGRVMEELTKRTYKYW